MNVFISTTTFAKFDDKPLSLLKESGCEIKLNPFGRAVTSQELLAEAKDAEGLIAGTEKISADTLNQMKSLKVISRCGAGLDNVDLKTAKTLGIQVFNTPDVVTAPVAELTIGVMLSLMRHIALSDREIRQGKWKKHMGSLLKNKKVGIIGMGRIGSAVSDLLLAFGSQIFYYDPINRSSRTDITCLELNELLSSVDIVTVHVPLSDDTKNMFNADQLKVMKKGSIFINCARGGLVDETALCALLKDNHLSGAALDVFEKEPYDGPLKDLDNIILTPHIGSYARESRIQMELESTQNLLKGFEALQVS